MKGLIRILAAIFLIALPASAHAQSATVDTAPGDLPTSAQWKSDFATKLDFQGGAANAIPYYTGLGTTANAVVSGDCSALSMVFLCTTMNGVAAGNLYPLNAGTGLSISGGSLNLAGVLPGVQFGSSTPAHIATGQIAPPALTSCGTGSPAIAGTDSAGVVTMGTGATGCVITFSAAYISVPFCVVAWMSTVATKTYAVSAAAITLTQTSTSGNQVQYMCIAQAGG